MLLATKNAFQNAVDSYPKFFLVNIKVFLLNIKLKPISHTKMGSFRAKQQPL